MFSRIFYIKSYSKKHCQYKNKRMLMKTDFRGSIPAVIIVSPKLEYNFNDTLALKTIQEKVNSIEQYLNEYLLMKSFDELQDKNKIKQEVKDIINNKILLKSIVKDVIFTDYMILKSPLQEL